MWLSRLLPALSLVVDRARHLRASSFRLAVGPVTQRHTRLCLTIDIAIEVVVNRAGFVKNDWLLVKHLGVALIARHVLEKLHVLFYFRLGAYEVLRLSARG